MHTVQPINDYIHCQGLFLRGKGVDIDIAYVQKEKKSRTHCTVHNLSWNLKQFIYPSFRITGKVVREVEVIAYMRN